MENKTATQVWVDRIMVERSLGVPPKNIRTEEDYLRWALVQIEQRAREQAEPYLKRLAEIESLKPMKPVYIPLDEWPDHLVRPLSDKPTGTASRVDPVGHFHMMTQSLSRGLRRRESTD